VIQCTAPVPDARRCINHELGSSVQRVAWKTITYGLPKKVVQYGDFIDFYALYWNNTAGQLKFTDAVTGKGFMEKDLTNYAGGGDALLWLTDDLDILPHDPWANASAKIPFVILDPGAGAHGFVVLNH
jgi:hypothetical protein